MVSQTFDAERHAQEALGWTTRAAIEAGELVLTITGPDGAPVQGATVSAVLGRATVRTANQTPAFISNDAEWRAPVTVAPGQWHLRLEAVAADGTVFRQRLDLLVE